MNPGIAGFPLLLLLLTSVLMIGISIRKKKLNVNHVDKDRCFFYKNNARIDRINAPLPRDKNFDITYMEIKSLLREKKELVLIWEMCVKI